MADKVTQGAQRFLGRPIIRKRVVVRFDASCELVIVDSELCALQDWLRQQGKEITCKIVCPEDEEDDRGDEGPPSGQTTNQNCNNC